MSLTVRVFTHPACGGCGEAVRRAWEVSEKHPTEVTLRTVSLESAEGLAEAHAEKVMTIPTIIVSRGGEEQHRIVGTPKGDRLEREIDRLLQEESAP